MKKSKKLLISILLLALFVCLTVNANGLLQKIEAISNGGLKIVIDDKDFVPTDNDGKKLNPITYNDRTYLPLRTIAEALGKDVSYDEATQTIIIGDKKTELSYEGYITSASENYLTIYAVGEGYKGLLVVDITKDTKMAEGVKENLSIDNLVTLTTDGTLVRGLIPEVKAISIDNVMTGVVEKGTVKEVVENSGEGRNYFFLDEGKTDPTRVNISEETIFQNCTLDDLKANDKVKVYTTGISIMIYPPQVGAVRVVRE